MTKRLLRVLLVIGLVSAVLHGWRVAEVLRLSDELGVDLTEGPDTPSYTGNAGALLDGRPFSPLFRERVLYASLIAGARILGFRDQSVLWVCVPLEIPAILALGFLAWYVARKPAASVVAAVLYAAYPNTYQVAVVLMPDLLHAQLVVMALALTAAWVEYDRRSFAGLAALLWLMAQVTRPTMFLVVASLPWLLWRTFLVPGRRTISLLLCALTVVYPISMTVSNALRFGIARPSLAGVEYLHSGFVPRMKAMQRNALQPQSMTQLYREEREVIARGDPTWRSLRLFAQEPPLPGFHAAYRELMDRNGAFVRAHRGLYIRASIEGILEQWNKTPAALPQEWTLFNVPEELKRPASAWVLRAYRLALVLAMFGVALAWARGPRGLVLFTAVSSVPLVMAWTSCWWDSSRVKLVFDLLLLPFAAAAAVCPASWAAVVAAAGLGYLPRKLFGWPESSMWLIIAGVACGLCGWVSWRDRGGRRGGGREGSGEQQAARIVSKE